MSKEIRKDDMDPLIGKRLPFIQSFLFLFRFQFILSGLQAHSKWACQMFKPTFRVFQKMCALLMWLL